MNLIEFVEWLKSEMDRQDITQADLARSSGLSVSHISRIMSCQTSPSADALTAIARGLLDKLAALELDETGLLSSLASLDQQMQTTHAPQTPEQIDAQLARLLASPDLRRLLQGLISRIVVERSDDIITAQVQYFHPPEERPPPETMSLSQPPLGHILKDIFSPCRLPSPGSAKGGP